MSGLSVENLMNRMYNALGTDDDAIDNDAIKLFLNQSYWNLVDRFHFREKEVTATFDTVIGEARYEMPEPFDALRSLSITDPDSLKRRTIDKVSEFTHENVYDGDTDRRGAPSIYVRENCFARLYPVPDAAYTITIKYWTTLDDLDEDNPALPQAWHEIIYFGALWRAFIDQNDWPRANNAMAVENKLINELSPTAVKEEEDYRHAGVQVVTGHSADRSTLRISTKRGL